MFLLVTGFHKYSFNLLYFFNYYETPQEDLIANLLPVHFVNQRFYSYYIILVLLDGIESGVWPQPEGWRA